MQIKTNRAISRFKVVYNLLRAYIKLEFELDANLKPFACNSVLITRQAVGYQSAPKEVSKSEINYLFWLDVIYNAVDRWEVGTIRNFH